MKSHKKESGFSGSIFDPGLEAQKKLENAFEWMFKVVGIFLFIGIIIPATRIFEHGFSFTYIIQWIFAPIPIIVPFIKKKIRFKTRLILFWTTFSIYGAAGVFSFGLLGQGFLVMLITIIIAAVGGGKKDAIICISLCSLFAIIAGFLITQGHFSIRIKPEDYATSLTAWITAVCSLITMAVILSSFLIKINSSWFSAIRNFRESVEHYRDIFNAPNEAVFIHDVKTGAIIDVNRTMLSMFGYSEDEVKGLNVGDLSSGEQKYSQEQALENIKTALDNGSTVFEWRSKKKDNTLFWTEVSLKSSDIGGKKRIIAVVRDIEERKKTEAEKEKLKKQLLQAQKMEAMGQLAGGVAHDFNNFLQVIVTYSEIITDSLDPKSSESGYVRQIMDASRKAKDLVAKLLAFSRRQNMQPENHDLNNIVNNLKKMLQSLLGEHISIKVIPGNNLGPVYADSGMMDQIIINLCANAKDAMPEGGSIIIKTENVYLDDDCIKNYNWVNPGKYVLLSITDSGVGIDEETCKYIFEPFFTTKGKTRGTGLGLSIVYGIIKQHHGLIQVYSKPQKGTTFHIYLPESKHPASTAGTKKEDNATGGTETILYGEDDDTVRDLIQSVLEKAGYTVFPARNGNEVIDLFNRNKEKIDLVLLDVVMPGTGGYQSFKELRKIRPDIPVLFTSGYSEGDTHTNFILEQGFPLIKKPVNIQCLLKAIRRAIEGKE